MKKALYNMLSVFAGILLAIIIINSQNAQKVGHSEPMTKEEHQEFFWEYLDYTEGRE